VVRRRGGTDQDRATGARFDQHDAPQDYRAHHFLAERGFREQQRVRLLVIDLERVGLASAMPSTKEGLRESWLSSPEKLPGQCSVTGSSCPWPSRPVTWIARLSTT